MSAYRTTCSSLLGTHVSSNTYLSSMYLDGVKGSEFTNLETGEKVITGVRFKLSIQSNDSMEHLTKRKFKKKKVRIDSQNPPKELVLQLE